MKVESIDTKSTTFVVSQDTPPVYGKNMKSYTMHCSNFDSCYEVFLYWVDSVNSIGILYTWHYSPYLFNLQFSTAVKTLSIITTYTFLLSS